jgi:hypothetical protein
MEEKKKGEAQSRKISYNFLIFNERGIMQQTDARRERERDTHISFDAVIYLIRSLSLRRVKEESKKSKEG